MANPEAERYLYVAKDLAIRAGAIARASFAHTVEHDIKHDGSPVTSADQAINDLVVRTVETEFPNHFVLAEEGNGGDQDSPIAWVCDPIDGTRPFTWGIPVSMFSLAVTHEGVPKVAVLFEPIVGHMYTAVEGQGAWFTNTNEPSASSLQIGVSNRDTLAGAYGTISGYGKFKPRETGYHIHDKLSGRGDGARIIDFLATCFNGSLVAKGNNDFAVVGMDTAHDVAALALLIPEAGGKVTDLEGNQQRYDQPVNGAIITNGFLHDVVVEAVDYAYSRN